MEASEISRETLNLLRKRDFPKIEVTLRSAQSPQEAVAGVGDALSQLIDQKDFAILMEFYEKFDRSSPFAYLLHCAAASYYAMKGDAVQTDLLLRESAKALFQIFNAPWMKEVAARGSMLKSILQQCTYIDTTLKLSGASKSELKLKKVKSDLLIFAACNGSYFDRFGKEFIESAQVFDPEKTAIHIHVINPTTDTPPLFESSSRLKVFYTSERGPENVLYYSCRRFMIAGELMENYESDLLISDIDTRLLPPSIQIQNAMAEQDIDGGVFEFPGQEPMLLCHCSLGFYRKTDRTLMLLRNLAHYIDIKYREMPDLWTLDQCALFTLTRMKSTPLNWVDLKTLTGRPLEEFQENQTELATLEKEKMRRSAQSSFGDLSRYDISLDRNSRPIFSRRT